MREWLQFFGVVMICTIDLETSGFDRQEDHITEIAWTIKEHGEPRSVVDRRFYVKGVQEIPENVVDLTGITVLHCDVYGEELHEVVSALLLDIRHTETQYMAAHNGKRFDKPFLLAKDARAGELPPWLDTLHDIPWPNTFRCHQLGHLCAEFGFINPFPHNGLSDVWSTAKLLDQFDLKDVITRSRSTEVTIFADVSFDDRQEAKDHRFRWEKWHDRHYSKSWVKVMKQCDYDPKHYKFKTKVIDKWE